MPAYYEDCGVKGHSGDSEFISIDVVYNASTQHWELWRAFTSAHAGTIANASHFHDADDVDYPSGRQYSYPAIWVADDKHGNFRSYAECQEGALWSDYCDAYPTGGRILVYEHRGVGSRFYDRLECVASGNALYYDNGRTECFYTQRSFNGWQAGSGGVTPYYDFLMSAAFECFAYAGVAVSYCYYGAGVITGP